MDNSDFVESFGTFDELHRTINSLLEDFPEREGVGIVWNKRDDPAARKVTGIVVAQMLQHQTSYPFYVRFDNDHYEVFICGQSKYVESDYFAP